MTTFRVAFCQALRRLGTIPNKQIISLAKWAGCLGLLAVGWLGWLGANMDHLKGTFCNPDHL